MAPRKEARIKTSRWDQADWTALPIDAQWLYDVMLSQKSLTQAGVLLIPRREWSNLASDADIRSRIASAREILEQRRFIVVDEDTDEVLIRTYIRHDVLDGPPGVFVGAMEAIPSIASGKLRDAIRDELLGLDREKVVAKKAAHRQTLPVVALDRALTLLGPTDGGPGGHRSTGASESVASSGSDATSMPQVTHVAHGQDMACDNHGPHGMSHGIGVGVGVGEGVTVTEVDRSTTAAAREREKPPVKINQHPQVLAARLVGEVLPPTIGRQCRGALARMCGDRMVAGADIETCRVALQRWVDTSKVSTNALEFMLDDAIKEKNGARQKSRAGSSRTADSVRGALAAADRYAAEEAMSDVIQLPVGGTA